MKLRTKIYMIATLPCIILAVLSLIVTSREVKSSIIQQAYNGMDATAVSIRNIFKYASTGGYRLDNDNNFWKGDDLNISDSSDIVDDVKEQTGYDVTIFFGDTRYLTTIVNDKNERQVGTKANDDVIEAVLEKNECYGSDNVNIFGTRYICYYVPLYQDDDPTTPVGMVFLGEEYRNIYKQIMKSFQAIAIPIIIILILSAMAAGLMGKRIVNDIQTGIRYLNQLENGRLGFSIEGTLLERKDIIGDMCRSIASLNNNLANIMQEIQKQCLILDDSSSTCHQTADSLNDSINQISAVVEEVAATTTSQAEDAEGANENIQSMGDLIENISDESRSTMDAINHLIAEMKQVEESVSTISDQTRQTSVSVGKISTAADLISSISLQTKLLSLNASIEAAHAGSLGNGFAVVAEEIQQLAQSSETSTKEIQEILDELKANSEKSLMGTEEVMETVAALRNQLSRTEEIFGVLLHEIGAEDDYDGYNSNSSPTLSQERSKTVSAVHDLAAASEEIAASMEQTAASVEEVANLAETMGSQANEMKNVSTVLEEHLNRFIIEK